MPTPGASNIPPPKSWDEFEDICADLFGALWSDPNATRYGRQGQRQNGVDIYGTASSGGAAGVQCKGRRKWPPRKLTIADIDDEVAKAKEFKPALAEFTLATISPDDAVLQDHVREVTERHRKRGLFSVYVVGWGEISRRLTTFPRLVEKHYGFISIEGIRDDVEDLKNVVLEKLNQFSVDAARAASEAGDPGLAGILDTVDSTLHQAVDRDLSHRYIQAFQRSFFPEASKQDAVILLAEEILGRELASSSSALRRRIFLRASRIAASQNKLEDAEAFLNKAERLDGLDSVAPARARLSEAKGEVDKALCLVRDAPDAESRTVCFQLLLKHKGISAAPDWLSHEKIGLGDLTANGVHALAVKYLETDQIEKALGTLSAATEDQLAECPHLLFMRAVVRLGSLFPKPEQGLPLQGLPLDVRNARARASADVPELLDATVADFHQVLPTVRSLNLRVARRTIESQLLWCRLLHPRTNEMAMRELRQAMEDPSTALSKLQFAFAYDQTFDPKAVTKYLEGRERTGGLNDEELRAAFVLRLHSQNPRSVAEFVAQYRSRLESMHGRPPVAAIEIQALAMAGDVTSARLALEEGSASIGPKLAQLLSHEIAKAEGADAVAEYRKAYEGTESVEALRALVGELQRRRDHRAIAHYAEILYAKTGDPDDAILMARGLAKSGAGDAFVAAVEKHPLIKERDDLARFYGWKLFEGGRLKEAQAVASELRKGEGRDLDLEIALAIESGEWETLADPLGTYLQRASAHTGAALIRAAKIAQASGQAPFLGLVDAAVERSPTDPNVLIGAYAMVVEAGLEEQRPATKEWFSKALDLSGPEGPVKRFELKELLPQHTAWVERSKVVNDAVTKAELPLIFAATALRTTGVDIVLGNLIRNTATKDPRRRIALPLLSGRARSDVPRIGRLALDITTLMVLGWLNLLPKVLAAYDAIVIPAGAIAELFEGVGRMRAIQRSRLVHARQVQEAIARNRLNVIRSEASATQLVTEIGHELATLLRAAVEQDGYVVRPAPIKRIGLDVEGEAEVTDYRDRLVDMHVLLEVLRDSGACSQADEETARRYFDVQDKGWGTGNRPRLDRPLFIDGLALAYLQSLKLLDAVLATFPNATIHQSVEQEAHGLLDHEKVAEQVTGVVNDIRTAIGAAHRTGKVIFGAQRRGPDEGGEVDGDDNGWQPSTLNLLSDLRGADAVLFDDRAINKEVFAIDRRGSRAQVLTSLDIATDLLTRGALSANEVSESRRRLRVGGSVLVPTTSEEIAAAATRNQNNESSEFRAIRESVALARIANIPTFPQELSWFAELTLACQHAATAAWIKEANADRASQITNAIWELRPNPVDWTSCWKEEIPPNWEAFLSALLIAGAALPLDMSNSKARTFGAWLEEHVLASIRELRPGRYAEIVQAVESMLLRISEVGKADSA